MFALALLNEAFQPHKSAAANKQDIPGIDPDVFLLRMFATSLRRDIAGGAFQNLQQRLLDSFAGNIAGDGNVFSFSRDFINFVDVNNAALSPLDIIIGVLQQTQDDVLNVLADI